MGSWGRGQRGAARGMGTVCDGGGTPPRGQSAVLCTREAGLGRGRVWGLPSAGLRRGSCSGGMPAPVGVSSPGEGDRQTCSPWACDRRGCRRRWWARTSWDLASAGWAHLRLDGKQALFAFLV